MTDLGFSVDRVTQLKGNISKQLLPIFLITLPRNLTNAKIFDLKSLSLCYLSITVDGFNRKGATQCFKCNLFNHTAENCHLAPRCLKCGNEHQTRECQIVKLGTLRENCEIIRKQVSTDGGVLWEVVRVNVVQVRRKDRSLRDPREARSCVRKQSLNVRSGRGRKHVSAEAIEKVALQVEEDKASNVQASTSVRLVAEALDLPRSTVQKIM
ncbi:uncharacterized protein TNCV_4265051 [Trichonephila clavipes]|nr:uncharacterized protein TNCV_4265051 [Trichonephila clavipes]